MDYLGLTLPTLAENLALDEALLLRAEQGPSRDLLRLWEWPSTAVILGAGSVLAADVDEAACHADGVPILRRSSGGGTVLLGPGCLLYTLVLAYDSAPELTQISSSYCYILKCVCASLNLPALQPRGTSDLAQDALKVSGNAQQRKRHHLLHHGSLLYAFNVALLGRYLRMPARQPAYRQQREHAEFVTNLTLGKEELAERLRSGFGADQAVTDWPADLVRELVQTKYGLTEWTRRR
jgi:lipoate---protein ligase